MRLLVLFIIIVVVLSFTRKNKRCPSNSIYHFSLDGNCPSVVFKGSKKMICDIIIKDCCCSMNKKHK